MDLEIEPVQVKWRKLEEQVMDWGVKTLRVYEVWQQSQGEDVKIAVLDTGVSKHPDLANNVKGGINFSSSLADDYEDRVGHGTHVAGIIAAINNNIGVVGVAPKAQIYAIKVLGDSGAGSYDMVAQGISWAIENQMDIISMSLGSNTPSTVIHEVIKQAYDNNITIIAAAGNDGDDYPDDDIDYPARYPEVIAVGAVNKYLERSWFSGDGKELDIMAPGQEINSTYLNQGYAILSGTSMAAPFITGVVALLIAKHRKTDHNATPIDTPERVREHLLRTADDAGEIGRDNFYGYGIVSPKKLLQSLNISSLY